jgi:osmotically-inducible protein OsmY
MPLLICDFFIHKKNNMKTNEQLQKDVQNALKWEPLLGASEIGVIVKTGIVTLTGTVDSYQAKLEAEAAAKNVSGVQAVVEKIEVSFGNWGKKSDNDIATEVINALKWNWQVPDDAVKIKIEDGWVTLDGTLEWNYQKEAAKKAVATLIGVKGVTNNISIKSEKDDSVEKEDIESAIGRNWSVDDEDIEVSVSGNKVTLNGTVSSFYQKDEAERIAWNAPGVWSVDNELVIEYD